ncbi:hypothetical protein LSH36_1035g01037 [Paralvinella palmiformis]|uniref:Neuronal membrane glycoprotein M6-b n=1 Tax=Paralvinella palmiformis TaxID=53620 RepID=A0AAD9IWE6_9ANNE|nr:hypothetical protein LSH36_1035g01037 [Paralvinella palmiformis]
MSIWIKREQTCSYNQLRGNNTDSNSSPDHQPPHQQSETRCMGRCCRCLAAVPCSALMCWIMTVVAVSACGGSLMVATRRTTVLFEIDDIFKHKDVICLGVIFSLIFLVTLLLIAVTFTSQPLSAGFLSSSKKTKCVLAWLIMEMLLLLLLLLAWLAVCIILTYPIVIFFIVYIRHYQDEDCIDLTPYIIPQVDKTYCGASLDSFYKKSILTFEAYVIALVGAVLVVFSMVFHLMYTAANYIQIRESGPSNYDIYKNEVANKHPSGSVLDTRM